MIRLRFVLGCIAISFVIGAAASSPAADSDPLTLVVMDPLSKPLSCDCVQGYAQREYAALGAKLKQATGREVKIIWHQSLVEALKESDGAADLVVGKHSVVLSDAKAAKRNLIPVAQLTGKDGSTRQHGLIVVRSEDAAKDLTSLSGYTMLLGPAEAEEKAGAAEKALREGGVRYEDGKRYNACSEAATAMLKMPKDVKVAAVISSYAEPLLKGCGSIREGELRVVAKTEKVPFVTAFLSADLPGKLSEKIQIALLTAGTDREFLKSMESLAGFVPWIESIKPDEPKETSTGASSKTGLSWPQFRGPNRDGRVKWLPKQLPDPVDDLVWSQELPSGGLGGAAISGNLVVVGGRDATDRFDTFTAFSLTDGSPLWHDSYPAAGAFDYGNTPRATPLVTNSKVFTLGTSGTLSALDVDSGDPIWRVDLAAKFNEEMPTWGFCSSPLLIGETLYVQLGRGNPLVAMDASTGQTRWSGPGRPSGYSSLVSTSFRGHELLIGIDRLGYFIRKADDGRYLWFRNREFSGDFAVPAPIVHGEMVFFTGENNGIEGYGLEEILTKEPSKAGRRAINDELLPDSHTPVAVGDQLLVAYEGLHCLDLTSGLAEQWCAARESITAYASIIASDRRAMVTTEQAKLILVEIGSGKVIDEVKLADNSMPLLSHPAIAKDRLVVRVGNELRCYRLR